MPLDQRQVNPMLMALMEQLQAQGQIGAGANRMGSNLPPPPQLQGGGPTPQLPQGQGMGGGLLGQGGGGMMGMLPMLMMMQKMKQEQPQPSPPGDVNQMGGYNRLAGILGQGRPGDVTGMSSQGGQMTIPSGGLQDYLSNLPSLFSWMPGG